MLELQLICVGKYLIIVPDNWGMGSSRRIMCLTLAICVRRYVEIFTKYDALL